MIATEPASPEAFAPFGTLLRHDGRAGRHPVPETLAQTAVGLAPALWINRLPAVAAPVTVRVLERHPSSAQSFVPMSGGTLLAIVCPTDEAGKPDPARLRAFRTAPGEGICYRPGTWHHGLLALGGPVDVLVVMAAHGDGRETETLRLHAPVLVTGER